MKNLGMKVSSFKYVLVQDFVNRFHRKPLVIAKLFTQSMELFPYKTFYAYGMLIPLQAQLL